MIDELEWVKRERPPVDAPSDEARVAARTALEKAIAHDRQRWSFRPRLSPGRGWFGPAAALAVTVAVVAVFLGLHGRKAAQPASGGGGVELVFRAEPSAEFPVVKPETVARAASALRARISPAGSVMSSGDTIFVHLGAGVQMSRSLLEKLENTGALLVFYDWEANVLTRAGRPVAGLLQSGSPQALQISQGAATAGPGSPGAGSMTLYEAVRLASEQRAISDAQCAQQRCSRFGREYFAFAASHSYLAGPASSPSELLAMLPHGATVSHAQTLTVPQGTVILQAAPAKFGHAARWSDPAAQYYVLRDRASLFGNEITNPKQSVDQSGSPDLTFGFTSKGASAFRQTTRRIARRGSQVSRFGQSYFQHFAVAIGTQLISVPSIDFHVYPDGVSGTGGADIVGGFTVRSAQELASRLRVAPLPVRLQLLSVSQASRPTSPAAQVVTSECSGSGAAGRVSQSCNFVLSDGRRFRCHREVKGQPTGPEIKAAGCVALRPLSLSPRERALIRRIDSAKRCLASHGLRVVGGPVLPPNPASPDGELVVSTSGPTFIAFYIDAAKARRLGRGASNAQSLTYGSVRIVWGGAASAGLQTTIEPCVFG
jgi:hypothetical protein